MTAIAKMPMPGAAGGRVRDAAASHFPGFETLVDGHPTEPVIARLHDGGEVSGMLRGFFADDRVEIETASGALETVPLASLRHLQFVVPVKAAKNAELYRKLGIHVETLPAPVPFSLAFTDGHQLRGELCGYGASHGGLGLYLTGEGSATRMFVPASGIREFSIGEQLGQLLLARKDISAQGLDLALERQRALRKQRLGDLLLERRLVTRKELEQAIAAQLARPMQRLGEVLIEMGMLTRRQLATALTAQRANRRRPIGEILIELQMIDRATLQAALALKLGIPFVDLKRYRFDADWADLAPYPVCRDQEVVPLFKRNGSVVVALENPLDFEKLNALSFVLETPVTPVLAAPADIRATLERHPERALYETRKENVPAEPAADAESENAESLAKRLGHELARDVAPLADQQVRETDSTLVRLVNKIISDAYEQKASDIHFEPGDGQERLRVRFRRDGALSDYLTLAASFRPAIVSRLKIMANLDISEHRRAQDGKIDFKRFGGLPLELRMACVPTSQGLESVVLRLLAAAKPLPLARLGLEPLALSKLRTLAEKPFGLIVVCGPTGSGKTTTLHSLLAHLNTPDTKIWTAEDPVEITQHGLNQVQVQPAIGWTFAAALRSFLRADPDVIMVGEVRDSETARIVAESSLTGHLVLTTLHTNSAPESVTRLVEIGVDRFMFADALLGVLAQRLTRRVCARCAHKAAASDDAIRALAEEYCAESALKPEEVAAAWLTMYGARGHLELAETVGCKACNNIGYSGRVAIYELLVATPALKRLILQNATVEAIRAQAMAEGMRTLKQDGIEKVLQGLTTIAEVRAAAG